MKTVLITGSGGFIGSNLKEALFGKYNLLFPRSFELDLCDKEEVRKYFKNKDIDFIIHCASTGGVRGVEDSSDVIEKNLLMADNLLENKKAETKTVLFGSGAMYDRFRELHKVREEEIGKNIPNELYGRAKMLISQKIEKRDDVVCLNIFGCYGKNEKPSRFPSYAISQNLRKEKIEINQNVVFDYLYIEDLIKIIEFLLVSKPKYNIFNVTPDKSISLVEIAEIVNKISDFKSEIIIKEPKMKYEYTGDNQRLREFLPDFEFTSYEKGLKKLFEYIKNKG